MSTATLKIAVPAKTDKNSDLLNKVAQYLVDTGRAHAINEAALKDGGQSKDRDWSIKQVERIIQRLVAKEIKALAGIVPEIATINVKALCREMSFRQLDKEEADEAAEDRRATRRAQKSDRERREHNRTNTFIVSAEDVARFEEICEANNIGQKQESYGCRMAFGTDEELAALDKAGFGRAKAVEYRLGYEDGKASSLGKHYLGVDQKAYRDGYNAGLYGEGE